MLDIPPTWIGFLWIERLCLIPQWVITFRVFYDLYTHLVYPLLLFASCAQPRNNKKQKRLVAILGMPTLSHKLVMSNSGWGAIKTLEDTKLRKRFKSLNCLVDELWRVSFDFSDFAQMIHQKLGCFSHSDKPDGQLMRWGRVFSP